MMITEKGRSYFVNKKFPEVDSDDSNNKFPPTSAYADEQPIASIV